MKCVFWRRGSLCVLIGQESLYKRPLFLYSIRSPERLHLIQILIMAPAKKAPSKKAPAKKVAPKKSAKKATKKAAPKKAKKTAKKAAPKKSKKKAAPKKK